MDKVLVVGEGLIGKTFYSFLKKKSVLSVCTTRKKGYLKQNQIFLDLTDKILPELSGYSHALIAASITSFDACENNPIKTREVNVNATHSLVQKLLKLDCKILYLSSTAVLPGNEISPNEDAMYGPVTEYGRQKADIERELLAFGKNVSVVRLTKVVSQIVPIFSHIYQKVKSEKKIILYKDLYISPISVTYVIESLYNILQSNLSGIFHLSNIENLSYSSFAMKVAAKLHVNPSCIIEVPSPPRNSKVPYANLGMKRTSELLHLYPESMDTTLSHFLLT